MRMSEIKRNKNVKWLQRTIGFAGALDSPRWSRDGRVYGGRGVRRYGLRGMESAIKLTQH